MAVMVFPVSVEMLCEVAAPAASVTVGPKLTAVDLELHGAAGVAAIAHRVACSHGSGEVHALPVGGWILARRQDHDGNGRRELEEDAIVRGASLERRPIEVAMGIEGHRRVTNGAVSSAEGRQYVLGPRAAAVGGRTQFVDHAISVRATLISHSIEVAGGIRNEALHW